MYLGRLCDVDYLLLWLNRLRLRQLSRQRVPALQRLAQEGDILRAEKHRRRFNHRAGVGAARRQRLPHILQVAIAVYIPVLLHRVRLHEPARLKLGYRPGVLGLDYAKADTFWRQQALPHCNLMGCLARTEFAPCVRAQAPAQRLARQEVFVCDRVLMEFDTVELLPILLLRLWSFSV